MRAQEMVDHLWCARLSLEDGQLLVLLLGELDVDLTRLESTPRLPASTAGSTPTKTSL